MPCNVTTGKRIRLTSSTSAAGSFSIAGIYSRGQGRASAYVTLRTGQSLFGYGTAVNAIYVFVMITHDDLLAQAADRILLIADGLLSG